MILKLYLVSLKNGVNLYTYNKHIEQNNKNLLDEVLHSTILFSIIKSLMRIIPIKRNHILIDSGEINLIFKFGKYVCGIILSNNNCHNELLLRQLDIFVSEFEMHYKDYLENWNGNRSIFEETKQLIEKIFGNNFETN